MSMISEQIKTLKRVCMDYVDYNTRRLILDAVDTIESMSEKLQAATEELERWHTDRISEIVKNPFANTSTLLCNNCDHKDEYIEELEAMVERQSKTGGWIPCSERMPRNMEPVLVCDKQGNVCVRTITCEIKGEKYWSQDKTDVVAWQPLPEPYYE